MKGISLTAAMCLVILGLPKYASARPHFRHSSRIGSSVGLRKRLHINDLITEPGTAEIDWANLYSFTTSNFSMPSALKYTPAGNSILWGRTEYSISFDSISSAVDLGPRTTQFSDRVALTATSVVFDSTHFDIAIAPQATAFLRDESGWRYGATLIAREDLGLNSMGATVSWSGASSSSSSNPAGTWDFSGGFGRHLGAKGVLGHFTPHVNIVWERSTGLDGSLSSFAGVEYQITARVSIDASAQRIGSNTGPDRQVLMGMTINLGKGHPGQ
jgi:hypothetical protein